MNTDKKMVKAEELENQVKDENVMINSEEESNLMDDAVAGLQIGCGGGCSNSEL